MSDRGYAKFSPHTRDLLDILYTNCAVCNCCLTYRNCTREHVIPVSVYKWGIIKVPEYDDNMLIKRTLGSLRNGCRTCINCNDGKSVHIIHPNNIKEELPYLDNDWYSNYRILYNEVEPLINSYIELLNEVAERDNYKCSHCGCDLSVEDSIPRRKDTNKNRSVDNCKLLCFNCNRDNRDNHNDDRRKLRNIFFWV